MVIRQNSYIETIKRDDFNIRNVLQGLAKDISNLRHGAEFRITDQHGWGDDPAKYIKLVQVGPEGNFLFRKKSPLVAVRSSNYSDFKNRSFEIRDNCPIQVTCFDVKLEEMIAQTFDKLAKELEVPGGVIIYRFGYSKIYNNLF